MPANCVSKPAAFAAVDYRYRCYGWRKFQTLRAMVIQSVESVIGELSRRHSGRQVEIGFVEWLWVQGKLLGEGQENRQDDVISAIRAINKARHCRIEFASVEEGMGAASNPSLTVSDWKHPRAIWRKVSEVFAKISRQSKSLYRNGVSI